MPTTVKIRRSGTASATPSALEHGEIAINYADGKVFWKNASDVITSFTFQSYALASHTHAASDITSGTLDAARLPLATTGAAGAMIVGTGLGVSSGTVSVTYGTTSGTACQGNDSRLSDARTPTSHSHGNITNAGAIGSTADQFVVTTTSGVLTAVSAATARTTLSVQPTASPTFTGTVTVPGLTATAAILADDAASSNSVVYSFDGDNNTGIGRGGNDILTFVTNGTERVRVDASGNVGIGTQSPNVNTNGTVLHIHNSTASRAAILHLTNNETGSTSTDGVILGKWSDGTNYFYDYDSYAIVFGTANAERMRIATDGVVTMPDVYEDTVGATNRDLFIDSAGKLGYVSSIRESKTDIVTLDDVSWLSALAPVSYRYRKRNADGTYSDEADGVTDYGLIAEDVEAVRPELCFYDDVDGEPQLRGVTYSKLITPMLRYIQQLEQRIAALEERLNG